MSLAHKFAPVLAVFIAFAGVEVRAADVEGVQEHPMIERYPGQPIGRGFGDPGR